MRAMRLVAPRWAALACAVAVALMAGVAALDPCVPFSEIKDRLSYCKGVVTWDVTLATNASLEALEAQSLETYQELMYKWKNDTLSVPVACLSYEPVYACTQNIRRCITSSAREVCQKVCEERNFRCKEMEVIPCDSLPTEDCSAAGRGAGPWSASVLAVAALVAAAQRLWQLSA